MTTGIDLAALTPDVTTATFASPDAAREALRTDAALGHAALRAAERLAVRSNWHADLQDAVDVAIATRRPLIIEPGRRELVEPLRIHNTAHLTVWGAGARLVALTNLPCAVDLMGTAFCRFSGLHVVCEGAVEDAIYVHHDDAQTVVTTTCLFEHTFVQGAYNTGIRVGAPMDVAQCDMMRFYHTTCMRLGGRGGTGLVLGSGVHANNVAHAVWGLNATGHAQHVEIAATNAVIDACSFDGAEVDLLLNSAWCVTVRGVRSESAGRFVAAIPHAGYAAQVSLSDVEWWGQDLHADGAWLAYNRAGVLRLANVKLLNTPQIPVVRARPATPLALRVSGLMTDAAMQNAFDLSASVRATVEDYVQCAKGIPQGVTSGVWAGAWQ